MRNDPDIYLQRKMESKTKTTLLFVFKYVVSGFIFTATFVIDLSIQCVEDPNLRECSATDKKATLLGRWSFYNTMFVALTFVFLVPLLSIGLCKKGQPGSRCLVCCTTVLLVICLAITFLMGTAISIIDFVVMITHFNELVLVGKHNVLAGVIHIAVDCVSTAVFCYFRPAARKKRRQKR